MSFSTILAILGVLTNFWTLALIAVLLAGAAAVFYTPPPLGGPAKLIKIALNPLTWIGILGALAIIYIGNATKVIEEQKQEIQQNAVQNTAKDDGIAVITDDKIRKDNTKKSSGRVRKAIETAPLGDEIDAALDQIAREQCSLPVNGKRPDCLRK